MALGTVPGTALNPNPLTGHEGGIKTDAKLTDQVHILAGGLGQLSKKSIGTGMGNGAEVGLKLGPAHADPGIADGKGVLVLVQINGDLQGHMGVKKILDRKTLVTKLLQGISGIGDQFPNEDIPFRIERINNDIKKFFGFCLKFVGGGLTGHDRFLSLC
jgi:hypothetical protein